MQLQPTSSEYAIPYPSTESEFEVQAFLYSELKAIGVDVRGEVKVFGAFGLRKAKASCRFDLVIFSEGKPVLIVEVKAKKVMHKAGIENTRQGKRYPMFGVPVQFVYGKAQAEQFLKEYADRGSCA